MPALPPGVAACAASASTGPLDQLPCGQQISTPVIRKVLNPGLSSTEIPVQTGLLLTGQRLTPAQRGELHAAESRAGAALRTRWLIAKEAARRAGTLPDFLDTRPQGDQQ